MELAQITFDFDESSGKKGDKKIHEGSKNLNSRGKTKSPRGRKNLKGIVDNDAITIPEDEILFKKVYYSIGDVSKMFNENASLIRYWENEFDILKPKKNAKGDRFFRPEDVKNLKLIHHLLRQRKYTIEGAKEFLKSNKTAAEKFEMIRSLQKLKSFLNELKASL
ncbi:MAG TPA: MerR family transcriptional regulator [Chitinophagaceae bacterium]